MLWGRTRPLQREQLIQREVGRVIHCPALVDLSGVARIVFHQKVETSSVMRSFTRIVSGV